MSHSSLATVVALSPNKTSPRNHVIDSVAIHHMAGVLTCEQCGDIFKPTSRNASSNYGIGNDGRIACYVEEEDRAWTTSSAGVDNRAITIEVSNSQNGGNWPVSDAAYAALIELLADICKRNNIPGLKWANDKAYAQAAASGGPVDAQNMFIHEWFANKVCPGPYLKEKHADIAQQVNTKLGDPNYSATAVGSSPIDIDYTQFNPYIVTIDRTTSTAVRWDSLIDEGIIGALVEAGILYSQTGSELYNFENNQIPNQIKNLEDADIPFGLYMTCRARNVEQAKEEMYRFSFVIRRYPPKLGVWLNLQLGGSKTRNDEIIDRYEKDLVRLGLTSKIGFYIDESMLERFSWDKYQERWYLWIIKHVDDLSELDTLLDPEFFDMDGDPGMDQLAAEGEGVDSVSGESGSSTGVAAKRNRSGFIQDVQSGKVKSKDQYSSGVTSALDLQPGYQQYLNSYHVKQGTSGYTITPGMQKLYDEANQARWEVLQEMEAEKNSKTDILNFYFAGMYFDVNISKSNPNYESLKNLSSFQQEASKVVNKAKQVIKDVFSW